MLPTSGRSLSCSVHGRAGLSAALGGRRREELRRRALAPIPHQGQLRFNSLARWLPNAEAAELRDAFEADMTRLYDAEDRRAEAG